jgi:hypothetical protein
MGPFSKACVKGPNAFSRNSRDGRVSSACCRFADPSIIRASIADTAASKPSGLQQLHDLSGDGLVNPKTTKRDTTVASMVREGAVTVIATGLAGGAAIGDMQLAAAVTQAQQAGQQRLTPPVPRLHRGP